MTANKPQVTAVIVTYQSRHTVGAPLEALQDAYTTGLADVIVVDNVSNDGTADFVSGRYPWVTLVRSAENLGYGRGLNLGMSHATTPYVLLMNPDAVLLCDALRKLVEFMDTHPRVGMSAPAIIEDGGSIQPAGVLPTPGRIIAKAAGLRSTAQQPIHPGGAPFPSDWLCGAILMARLEVIHAINGFDPRFFLYFEETDLCRRVSAHGYELWAVGEAVAHHTGSHSAKGTQQSLYLDCIAEHYFRSRFYYLVKYFGWPIAACTEFTELSLLAFRSLARRCLNGTDTTGFAQRWAAPLFRCPKQVNGDEGFRSSPNSGTTAS